MLFHTLVTTVMKNWQPAEFFVMLLLTLIDAFTKSLYFNEKCPIFPILGRKSRLTSCHSLSQYQFFVYIRPYRPVMYIIFLFRVECLQQKTIQIVWYHFGNKLRSKCNFNQPYYIQTVHPVSSRVWSVLNTIV